MLITAVFAQKKLRSKSIGQHLLSYCSTHPRYVKGPRELVPWARSCNCAPASRAALCTPRRPADVGSLKALLAKARSCDTGRWTCCPPAEGRVPFPHGFQGCRTGARRSSGMRFWRQREHESTVHPSEPDPLALPSRGCASSDRGRSSGLAWLPQS